jgi:hypothetical protein
MKRFEAYSKTCLDLLGELGESGVEDQLSAKAKLLTGKGRCNCQNRWDLLFGPETHT